MNYLDPLENEIVRGKIRVAQEEFRAGKRSGSVRIELHHCHGEPKRVIIWRNHWKDDETEISRVSEITLDEVKKSVA